MGICRGILVFRSGTPQRLSTAQFGLRGRRTGQALGPILANADDPLTASVFDPSIRGNTAMFIYKFTEPVIEPES